MPLLPSDVMDWDVAIAGRKMAASVDRQANKILAIPTDDFECFARMTGEIRFCMESFGNAISVLKTSDALEHVAVLAIQVP